MPQMNGSLFFQGWDVADDGVWNATDRCRRSGRCVRTGRGVRRATHDVSYELRPSCARSWRQVPGTGASSAKTTIAFLG